MVVKFKSMSKELLFLFLTVTRPYFIKFYQPLSTKVTFCLRQKTANFRTCVNYNYLNQGFTFGNNQITF